ncbi:MAG: FHA domain-containing protein [candidate division WOR-3 bacterium]
MIELHLKIKDIEIKVNKTIYILGSSNDCDYVYSKLSPRHMSFSYIDGKWILNAISEIKLNGNAFIGRIDIKNGDIIEAEDLQIQVILYKLEVPYFRIIVGHHPGSMIKIEKGGVIGRDVNADYVIEDEHVSRRHAILSIENKKVIWKDLEAKNPTLINGKVQKEAKELRSGDEILIGKTRLIFINPSEKPEHEIYKRPSRRPIFALIGILIVLISILITYFWTSNRINSFYQHYNSAKESLNKAFETDKIEEKISLLKYARYELEIARKYGKSLDLDILENLAERRLIAWENVLKIKNDLQGGNLNQAKEKLKNLEDILGEDKLFVEIYGQILRAKLISEFVSTAKALQKEGKFKEAKELLEIAQTKIQIDTPDLTKPKVPGLEKKIEIQSTLQEQKYELKPTKIKELSITSDIKLDIPEIGKFDIKPETQKPLISSGSVNFVLKLRELYEDKADLEGTISLANEILRDDPNNASAEFYIKIAQKEIQALQLEKEGRYKEALNIWSDILRLDPNNVRAKKAIVRLGSKI